MTALISNPKGTDITPSVHACVLLRAYFQVIFGQLKGLGAYDSRSTNTMPLSRYAGIGMKRPMTAT